MNLYVSLDFYALRIKFFATAYHFCVLYIVAILSLVIVRETSVFIYCIAI